MSYKDKFIYADDNTLQLLKSIKYERKKLGLSLRGLATVINISARTLAYYENGSRLPKLSTFLRLAKFFNWDISDNINFLFKRGLKSVQKQKNYYAFTVAELQELMFYSRSCVTEFLAGKGSICAFAQFTRIINEEKRRNNRK